MAKRGENIHKRKDGRWEGRYIKGRTAEGKTVWVCVSRSPGRADQAEGSVRILSAFREVNAFF